MPQGKRIVLASRPVGEARSSILSTSSKALLPVDNARAVKF